MISHAATIDSLAPSRWRARPRSFIALMSLYESNFLRLKDLVGDVRSHIGTSRSRIDGDCELLLVPEERAAHTSTFRLTYDLADSGLVSERHVPDALVRVYHDARLCEALSVGRAAARGGLVGAADRELDLRWTRNVMLNKWLEYCVERGHVLCARDEHEPLAETDRNRRDTGRFSRT